jgi:hypothetical protein
MRWRFPDLKTRYDVIGAIILVTGLLGALCIFIGADDIADPAQNVLGADLDESRKYLHVLESFGGKANVLAQEMTVWFASLWHGKNLAFTIAFLAVIVSFWFFFVDYFSDADGESENAKPGLPGKPRHR